MKNIIIAFCCLFLSITIISCKKSGFDYGVPTITKVTVPNVAKAIDTASLNQWLIIYGTNLASAQSVTFNDQTVPYDSIYANDTSVTVKIPRVIPSKVTNVVTVTTKGGVATYNFVTSIPVFLLTGMFNEYTPVGDTLTLLGQNFDLYGFTKDGTTVTFTGGKTATLTSASASALKLVVPSGVNPGPLTIKGAAPLNTTATSAAWYMDNRNFLFSMSPYGGWNGSSFISSGTTPVAINGPYFSVIKSWSSGWPWDPFCSNNCSLPNGLVNVSGAYINYALKFEMWTPASGNALPMKLYMCFNSGVFKDYYFDAGGGVYPFSTGGKWETFTVPLKNWGNLGGFVFSSSMIMEFMLRDTNAGQSNFSICNFRMVPIN